MKIKQRRVLYGTLCLTLIASLVACNNGKKNEVASSGAIGGMVKDKWVMDARNDIRQIPNAVVTLDGNAEQVIADLHGYYSFPNVAPGQHVVTASAADYDTGSVTVTVAASSEGMVTDIPLMPSRAAWLYSTGAAEIYYSSPALSADESTVYIGSGSGWFGAQGNNGFYALDSATGTLKWQYDLGALDVRSTPAVAADGSIYFVAESRTSPMKDVLYKLYSGGTLAWTYTLTTSPTVEISLSAPAIASDGTVYACGDGLFALNPNGTSKWHLSLSSLSSGAGSDVKCSPAVAADGTVYVGVYSYLNAVNPDGTIKWQKSQLGTGWSWLFPPAIGSGGIIYIGDDEGHVYAVNPADGTVAWTFTAPLTASGTQSIRTSPAVAADGTIYVGTKYGGILYALNPDGTVKWSYQQPDTAIGIDIYSSPAVGADGTVYFGAESGYVYALNASDGSLLWKFQTEAGINWSSPAIKSDGSLFIGNLWGLVCALRTESLGLDAGSSWPKFRRTNQNTAEVK